MYRKNTSGQTFGVAKIKATDGSDLTGFAVVVRSIDGAAFVTATGTFTADMAGASVFQMSQADTNGQNIFFKAILAGMINPGLNILTDSNPPDVNVKNVAGTAQTAIDLGTAIPNLSSAQLSGLTTLQTSANSISSNLAGLTSAQLSGFATVQTNTNALSSQLAGLTSAQLSGFATMQTNTNNLSSQLAGLTSAQLSGFATAQANTNALSSQIAGLTSAQLHGFTTTQTATTAIKVQTDKLNFHGSQVLADVKEVNDVTVNGAGTALSPWGP